MEVSKLELSEELLHQTSSQTKALLWIKSHEKQCQNTSILNIAKTIGVDKDRPLKMSTFAIQQVLYKLIRDGLLVRHGGRRRADFVINYGHPLMPPEVDNDVVKTTKTNARKFGEEAFKRLEQAEKDGRLAKAKNRRDVGILVGYSKAEVANNKRGYSWVSNLVHRGHLKEEWIDPSHAIYTVISTPDYKNAHEKKPKKKSNDKGFNGCSYEIVKKNGGKLPDLVYNWFVKHNNDDILKGTTANEIVRYILEYETEFTSTFESLKTIIRRLIRKGAINREPSVGRIGYFDFSANENFIDGDEKERLEYNEVSDHKEQKKQDDTMMANAKSAFQQYLDEGCDPIQALNLEERENKMEEQSVNLPDGKVINLTININLNK